MPWRYFYSTEESDTALKAILAGQDYVQSNSLVQGVYEYKILLDHDSDYAVLANKVALSGIRALASPERISQFGNIQSDNFFDSSVYAAGCDSRDNSSLAGVVAFVSTFPAGTLAVLRDLDIQGSASLGTVALTMSSLYSKTYNIPVNGSVSDRTMVRTFRDSTTPAVTQTNATCNSAMCDYASPRKYYPQSISLDPGVGTKAEFLEKATDKKSTLSSAYYQNQAPVFDFGQLITNGTIAMVWSAAINPGGKLYIYTSVDNISWSAAIYTHAPAASIDPVATTLSPYTFRYLKISADANYAFRMRELYAY